MIQYKDSSLTVYESALFKTTSTVACTDDLVLVVDPTWLPNEVEAIRFDVAKIANRRPVYVLLTHSDYDHIMGYQAFPEATLIASKALNENPRREEILAEVLKWDADYYIERPYVIEYPQVDIAIAGDAETVEVGKTKLHFYQAQGHNNDGLFTVLQTAERTLFICGDYLCDVEFPFIYHSHIAYMETLQKAEQIIIDHQPALLISGHGTVETSINAMLSRKAEAMRYIEALRDCVKGSVSFDIQAHWQRYQYQRGQQSFHDNNLALVRRELEL